MIPSMSDEQAAEMLGCTLSDTPRQIKEAFASLCRVGHPDLNPNGGFVDIGQAKKARDQLIVRYWRRKSAPV